jgi:hypothetical protein
MQPKIDATPGQKVRMLTLAALDKRTSAAKRARDLIRKVTNDLGGADQLATGECQVIQRAALLGVMAEDIETRWLAGEDADPALLATIANAQRRLFEAIGFRRRAKDVTPTIEDIANEIEAEEEAG